MCVRVCDVCVRVCVWCIFCCQMSEVAEAQALFTEILSHLAAEGVDIVVLGCTEFPILIDGMRKTF